MFEIGRLCVKIAGRDAGGKCVIVDILNGNFVLIDGQTRRRKCNVKHLEPLDQVISIKKNASHEEVVAEFKKLGLEPWNKKPKVAGPRPRKQRKEKERTAGKEKKEGGKEKKEKEAAGKEKEEEKKQEETA